MATPPPQQPQKKNLEDQDWYHGCRPRKDAIRLVSAPGEFLVRTSAPADDVTVETIITACDDNRRVVQITLFLTDDNKWYLKGKSQTAPPKRKFNTVVDLIDYYRVHPPSKALKLLKVVARPEWRLRQKDVVYEDKDNLAGAGSLCNVFRGKLLRMSGEPLVVAVKVPPVTAADPESEDAKDARKAMLQEAQQMSFYTHDNVVKFLGVACDAQPMLLLTEYCVGGSLLAHLLKHGEKTDAREKLVYLYEAARGLLYLHERRCVHRKLAARNCLISAQGRIKIADYGLSKLIDEYDGERENPVRWLAPEILAPVYTTRSDVWAFGVLTYEVFSNGVAPWRENSTRFAAAQIRQGAMPKFPEGTPCKVSEFVGRMWHVPPELRLSAWKIVRELGAMIKDASGSLGYLLPEKMTINLIAGVARDIYFEQGDDIGENDCDPAEQPRTPEIPRTPEKEGFLSSDPSGKSPKRP